MADTTKNQMKHAIFKQMQLEAYKHPNATSSPLLRLPAELRNKVYEYVFASHQVQLGYFLRICPAFSEYEFYVNPRDVGEATSLPHHINSLRSSCRQLYMETQNHMFTHSVFVLERTSTKRRIDRWYRLDVSEVDMIRNLRLVAKGDECEVYCEECEEDVDWDLLLMDVAKEVFGGLRYVTVVVGGLYDTLEREYEEERGIKARECFGEVDLVVEMEY